MSAQAALGKISGRGSGTAGSGARSEHEAPVRERHGTGLRWQQEGAAGGESRPPRRANLSSARPQAVQVGCLVLFVGGVAAALGGELRGRPRLADGAPGASDAEHAALRRVVEARYEEWIADFHPDNVVPPGRDSRGLPSIDRRHYHERSDHRMIWNEHVGDQRRHVSQFSLWLAEEAERAAARAELGWAWPADDEPAPEAEMEALDDVDSTKQLILAGGLPVSVFNQWAQLERMRLVLDAGARRLCIRGSEDRAHQDDGESEESWDVGKMRSRTKGNPALGPDVSAVARLCAGLPVSLQR
ncbi:unnamed protein product [Prorocentrum cordatum]|uniref:Uncharacterized protein n=1 Tax=Prorocentrum cordatum TaxID=2364126 RepID=A0ABN9TV00_9DINO|nr:unnamed protein product [Polarella glacialis]